MTNDKRVPAGIPTGGQFATSVKAEAGVGLGRPVDSDEAAVDAYTERINDAGRVEQIAFLRQMGLAHEEVRGGLAGESLREIVRQEVRGFANRETHGPAGFAKALDTYRFPLRAYDHMIVEDADPYRMAPGQAVRLTMLDPLLGKTAGTIDAVLIYNEKPSLDDDGAQRTDVHGNPIRIGSYTVVTDNGGQVTGDDIHLSDSLEGGGAWERETAVAKVVADAMGCVQTASLDRVDPSWDDLVS